MNHTLSIKVCGMTSVEQVNQLADMGINYAGFIFYPASARFVMPELTNRDFEKMSTSIQKVGVFVNAGIEELLETAQRYQLDIIQLHGNENADYAKQVAKFYPVIRAFHIADKMPDTNEFSNCNFFLFDTASRQYGGSGEKFNWALLHHTSVNQPFFISGGIAPGDIDKITGLKKIKPELYGVDINSRFEIRPGVKNMSLIKEFKSQLSSLNSSL